MISQAAALRIANEILGPFVARGLATPEMVTVAATMIRLESALADNNANIARLTEQIATGATKQ